ncbi:MAG: hypothetical protein QMC89_03405 [Candidatus Hodarchaeaceae archaeon]|nr:hypothetical protein [Candidatus Hodarchaeaceae archaeon]
MAELRVIADTSFLMVPGLFGVDVVGELDRLLNRRYKLVTPQPVVGELERLAAKGKPNERSAARLGLALLSRGEVIKSDGPADAEIVRLAGGGDCAVGTTDAALRRELRRRGVPVIYLRQGSHLAIDGKIG